MVTDRPYDGAGGNPYAAEGGTAADDSVKHLPQGQRQIWHFIKSQLELGDTQDEGVNIMAIARHVGLPVDRVREMTANMVEEGHLYDGLDGDQLSPPLSRSRSLSHSLPSPVSREGDKL